MMRALMVVAGLLCLAACGESGSKDSATSGYMDDVPPNGCDTDACPTTGAASGSGSSGGAADGTGGDADACKSSAECTGDMVCVAEFGGDQRGPYRCVALCVADMDEAQWCADSAACCNAGSTCSDRGYCGPDGGSGTAGSSTGG